MKNKGLKAGIIWDHYIFIVILVKCFFLNNMTAKYLSANAIYNTLSELGVAAVKPT